MRLRGWITVNLRLKLLALALSFVLLGAVAFSLNPVKFKTISVPVAYKNEPTNLILLNPQTHVPVTISGLSDAVDQAVAVTGSVTADVDLSHIFHAAATPPTDEPVTIVFHSGAPGVSVQPNVRTTVTVDDLVTKTLPIQVQTPNVAPGFGVPSGHATADPATVQVTGAESEISRLTPVLQVNDLIDGKFQIPALPVQFLDTSKSKAETSLSNTIPVSSFSPTVANVTVNPVQNQQIKEVALIASPQGQPACGYAITGVTFTPGGPVVAVIGPPDSLQNLASITLQPVKVDGATSDVSVAQNVPVPNGASGVSPGRVTVSFQIVQKFSCTPTPTPVPSPT